MQAPSQSQKRDQTPTKHNPMIQFHCSLIPLAVRSTALILALAFANIASAQVHNTKTGVSAGASITTGDEDTADGFSALQLTNTGSFDTAVGSLALQKNTAGRYENNAFGDLAMENNTSGSSNTAIGDDALRNNVDGSFNVAVGDEAGTGLGQASITASRSAHLVRPFCCP
jgi:hypothetical protein